MSYGLKACSCHPLRRRLRYQNFQFVFWIQFFQIHAVYIKIVVVVMFMAFECVLLIEICFNGWGMGPLLVLVSPCFRENVVVTCKIGSFLYSLDNLLQKNVIVFFFWKSNFKMALIWKKGYFRSTFHIFLVIREKLQRFLQHISHSHTYMYFAHPIDLFCLTNFLKKYEFIRYGFSLVWFLVLILIRDILEQSINNKMVSKI